MQLAKVTYKSHAPAWNFGIIGPNAGPFQASSYSGRNVRSSLCVAQNRQSAG